ncbi:MAG: hypothetical protein KDB86_09235 [Actinobacteria bacterium]|nr:hypothetical protein [Actinomycetota bacterium]
MSDNGSLSEAVPESSTRTGRATEPPAIHDWDLDGPVSRLGSLSQAYVRNGEWLGILTWGDFPGVELAELDERAMTLRYRPEAHPGLTPVIDAGVRDQKLWVLEEIPSTVRLSEAAVSSDLDSAGGLDRLVRSVAASVEALHRQRIVHGGISAESFFLGPDGSCVLAHSGLGTIRYLEARSQGPEALNAGIRAGARAPELESGSKPSAASDRFALGAVIYQAVTGVEPTASDLQPAAVAELLTGLGPDVPTSVRGALPRLLSPEPGKRSTGLTVLHRFGGATPAVRRQLPGNDSEQTMAVPAQPELIGLEASAEDGGSPWSADVTFADTSTGSTGTSASSLSRPDLDIPHYAPSGPIRVDQPSGPIRIDSLERRGQTQTSVTPATELTAVSGPRASTGVLWTPTPDRLGGTLSSDDGDPSNGGDSSDEGHGQSRKDRRRHQPPNPTRPWLVAALAIVATIAGLIILTREDRPASGQGAVVAGIDDARAGDSSAGGAALDGMSISIGSKAYTEQRILVEIVAQALEAEGAEVERSMNLGGTAELRAALVDGTVAMYPEFNTTAWSTIFEETADPPVQGAELTALLDERDEEQNSVAWVGFAPYNNTYGFAVRQATAELDALESMDDLTRWIASDDGVVVCMEPDFRSRSDGLSRFEDKTGYTIPEGQIREMAGSDIYLALAAEECDIGEVYTTDGRLVAMQLTVIADGGIFEPYNISITADADLIEQYPAAATVIDRALEYLDTHTMTRLNSEVDVLGSSEQAAAYAYLEDHGLVSSRER